MCICGCCAFVCGCGCCGRCLCVGGELCESLEVCIVSRVSPDDVLCDVLPSQRWLHTLQCISTPDTPGPEVHFEYRNMTHLARKCTLNMKPQIFGTGRCHITWSGGCRCLYICNFTIRAAGDAHPCNAIMHFLPHYRHAQTDFPVTPHPVMHCWQALGRDEGSSSGGRSELTRRYQRTQSVTMEGH